MMVETLQAWFMYPFWGMLILLGSLEYWLSGSKLPASRSARWPTNIAMWLLNGAFFSVLPISTIWLAGWVLKNNFGLFNRVELPLWLLFGATILIRSLAQYAFHWLSHNNKLLWRLHRVHHSDGFIDGSTAL